MTKVLLATNEPVLAEGIQTILSGAGMQVVAVCSDVCDLFEAVHRSSPDIAIVDLPVLPQPEVIRELRRVAPRCQVVLWPRPNQSARIGEALAAGARGVLPERPSAQQIVEALQLLVSFTEPEPAPAAIVKSSCNPTEKQCLALAGHGLNSDEIAALTRYDKAAVQKLLDEVSQRLGVGDRYELALYGLSTLKDAN